MIWDDEENEDEQEAEMEASVEICGVDIYF